MCWKLQYPRCLLGKWGNRKISWWIRHVIRALILSRVSDIPCSPLPHNSYETQVWCRYLMTPLKNTLYSTYTFTFKVLYTEYLQDMSLKIYCFYFGILSNIYFQWWHIRKGNFPLHSPITFLAVHLKYCIYTECTKH